jgi:tRNA-splicing ligase RtcB
MEGNNIIVRKGALSVKQGEMGIIPGSMGAKSYIVEGLGNPDSFMSSSHGAGRKMGRSAAKKAFTKEDLTKAMEGISYDKDAKILDEIPQAYKDIDQVMEYQKDLVKPVHVLKQILSIKGSE